MSFPDLRTVDDPEGVINPLWDIVRTMPGQPAGFPRQLPWLNVHGEFDVPYWNPHPSPDIVAALDGTTLQSTTPHTRWELNSLYSYSITDPNTVSFVAAHAGPRLVDVCAGTGYWAWQLAQRGVDVLAYDIAPPDKELNFYHHCSLEVVAEHPPTDPPPRNFHPTTTSDAADAAKAHPDRTMFLSWPPYNEDMAYRALVAYTGSRVIYIGEEDGCTGDDTFRDLLESDWRLYAAHIPVQWWGLHDRVYVYLRPRDVLLGASE